MVLILFLSHLLDEELPAFVSLFVGVLGPPFFGGPGNLPHRQDESRVLHDLSYAQDWLNYQQEMALPQTWATFGDRFGQPYSIGIAKCETARGLSA